MSKGDGLKIGIKFTEDLVGDVIGNESAFTITGQEYKYVDGPLIDGDYLVDKVERHPVQRIWGLSGEIVLPLLQEGSISENVVYLGTPIAHSVFSSSYPLSAAFDGSIIGDGWSATGTVDRWIGIDFGNNPQIITMFRAFSGQLRFKGFVFECSNDNSSWVTLKTGDLLNQAIWQEFEFINENEYRYYRIRCTSVYTGSNVSLTELEMYTPNEPYIYDNEFAYTFSLIQISGKYRIKWLESKLQNTDILVEYTTGKTQGQWQEAINGEVVNVGNNIWIRATLSTEDTTVTPTLQDLWLETPDVPQDKILITMDWWGKFNNVEGELTIAYDSTNGNLFGTGGPVESFEASFIPEDLIKRINPGHPHTFKVDPTVDISFVKIYYKHRFSHETFSVHPDCFINFEYVGVINP